MTNTFGSRLRDAMKAENMRVADLARLCGLAPRTLRRWFTMRNAPLAVVHAVCIADALGADLRQLVTNGERFRPRRKYSARRGHFWPRLRDKMPAGYDNP